MTGPTHSKAHGRRFALFAYGFRPFFLGAALHAVWGAIGWVLVWHGHLDINTALPSSLWHAHEMAFGFLSAAIAGFLLTAIPNWTGCAPLRGAPLALLASLWLAGRISAWTLAGDTPLADAIIDVGFLPALAAWAGFVIVRRRLWRNLPIVVLLMLLGILNLVTHLDALGLWAGVARTALYGAIGVVAVLVAIIGGRIVPAFTQNALRAAGRPIAIQPASRLDAISIGSAASGFVADVAGASDPIVAVVFAIAAAANFVRLSHWHPSATRDIPIVWVLHLGYAWLVLGFAIRAMSAGLGIGTDAMAIHAIALGSFGTMILAVMTRASLGHTGRPIHADGWTVAAYLCVSLGAAGRALVGPNLSGEAGAEMIGLSGALWAAGFAIFAIRYFPVLALSRPDGKPG